MLGTRTIAIDYDATNRVSLFSDSASGGGALQVVAHDGRGNMVTRGALALVYDEANQPVSVSGAANGTYMYDGHLKRVRQSFGGATTYSVYALRTGAILCGRTRLRQQA